MNAEILNAENFSWIARLGLVQALTCLLLILSLVSFSLPFTGAIRPLFILIPLYYWSVYRPTIMPLLWVFALGLLIDLIMGVPVGLHAALFVIAHFIIKTQRLFLMGQPYMMLWLGFMIVCMSVFAVKWLFFMALYQSTIAINAPLSSAGITILLFPIFASVLALVHRILPPVSKGL